MSQLVVDSSVAVKWFVVEPYSAEARRILTDYQTGVLTLLAPDLINAEIGNIVWKKHILQGMDAADAQKVTHSSRPKRRQPCLDYDAALSSLFPTRQSG